MRVLVTGASSLLAGSVARALSERGDAVVALQRNRADGLDVEQVLGDVRDLAAVEQAVRGCDAVVHAAAKVGVVGTWEDYRSVNVDGTANVLAAARRAGAARVVHVSSPSVAHGGRALVGAPGSAAVTGRRRAHYAESKALAERLALSAGSAELAVMAVRPHLVWGPGDTQLVGRIVERARQDRLAVVGGGRALVDATYLDDAVAAHVAALDALGAGRPVAGRAYVVASGDPRPIRDLAVGICQAAGVTCHLRDVPGPVARAAGTLVERIWPIVRDGEPPLTRFLAEQLGTAHWFDLRATERDLGWRAAVDVDEGLARLAAWFASVGTGATA